MTRFVFPAMAIAALAGAAQAEIYIPFGTSSGSMGVYYNTPGPEIPANQNYIRAQNSHTNTNGATFNFDNTLDLDPGAGVATMYTIFQSAPNQFGVDLVLPAPTTLGVGIPTLTAAEHTAGGPVGAGPVAWAINNYFGPTIGPADPANIVQQSLFRSNNAGPATLLFSNLTPIAGGFTIDASGFLNADGIIHWYTIGQPDTSMAAFFSDGLHSATGRIKFDGTLTYLTGADTTPGIDFYDGLITYQLELTPAPGAAGLFGLAGLAAARRRRR